ncbi:thiamine-monophosphate kinase [Sphingobium boeckii]|uniref:Thiamine-monophosphate kinase n=1 Tax=Sphingobium boeckii TaxID=1082345 RepID=A0A7W9AF11_9SPHN|nr:thiamine-monophosphate kinase [Sphingobium boeckii]
MTDDAAVLGDLVLTHDMIAEGVHFLTNDPPEDVAWKLVAVNLSDLAAKGATPLGVLMGYALTGDRAWDAGFVAGLEAVLKQFDVPLLGGDTVSLPAGAPRVFGLTAIGRAPASGAPSRSGAQAGDALFVTGTIGDAGLGLAMAQGTLDGDASLLAAYRRPVPRLVEGQALAGQVHAMMDVSDGLLLDASRMAEASGLAVSIDLDAVPLSPAFRQAKGESRADQIKAATAGDDYQLLFAAAPDAPLPALATPIGRFAAGSGISLFDADGPAPLPERLGYLHA